MMLLTGSRMAAQTHTPVTTLQRPKLVVGIVVDQMRWDYLYRYQKRYTEGGFRRMLSEGYTCENTALPYVPSVTAIGHTCIYTGSVPSIHGIAGNNFVKDGQKVYCTDDKTVKPVGSTSDAGLMSPQNLWTTTIGDEMRIASNGRAKVVGVSLKDRASILPAGHNPNGAYWFDDATAASSPAPTIWTSCRNGYGRSTTSTCPNGTSLPTGTPSTPRLHTPRAQPTTPHTKTASVKV